MHVQVSDDEASGRTAGEDLEAADGDVLFVAEAEADDVEHCGLGRNRNREQEKKRESEEERESF